MALLEAQIWKRQAYKEKSKGTGEEKRMETALVMRPKPRWLRIVAVKFLALVVCGVLPWPVVAVAVAFFMTWLRKVEAFISSCP